MWQAFLKGWAYSSFCLRLCGMFWWRVLHQGQAKWWPGCEKSPVQSHTFPGTCDALLSVIPAAFVFLLIMKDVSVAASYLHFVLLSPTNRQVAAPITTAAIITSIQIVAGFTRARRGGRRAGVGGGKGGGGRGIALMSGGAPLFFR